MAIPSARSSPPHEGPNAIPVHVAARHSPLRKKKFFFPHGLNFLFGGFWREHRRMVAPRLAGARVGISPQVDATQAALLTMLLEQCQAVGLSPHSRRRVC